MAATLAPPQEEEEAAVTTTPTFSSPQTQQRESGSLPSMTFMSEAQALEVAETFGTPCYVYDAKTLASRAEEALAFPNRYGLTVRYAMKACPTGAVLRLFDEMGLHFDASSTHEARRAIKAGIRPEKISLSTQELDGDFADLVELGVSVNACSLRQLEAFGEACRGKEVGIRFNPGVGSGGTSKTNVGGSGSSFGIWHELKNDVKRIADDYDLALVRVHTHIGSGSDPAVWQRVAKMSLELCDFLGPSVTTLNLGGGYKVTRVASETATDLQKIGAPVAGEFEAFFERTNTKLRLEVEPGTFLVANAGSLVARIDDIVATDERTFLKLDCGMTDILRPSLYGSQHPIVVVKRRREPASDDAAAAREKASYVVVGHCCESGDLLTPAPDQPDTLAERTTAKADPGDLAVIESAGAYCAAMAAKGYNSFPEPPEVLLAKSGDLHLIKKRSDLDQLLQNEINLPASALL